MFYDYLVLLGAFAWSLYWLYADASATAAGVKSGIAVEGNGLIVRLVGNKPTLEQFLLIETPIRLAIAACGFIPTGGSYPYALMASATAGLAVYGFKNRDGVKAWAAIEKK